MAYRVDLPEPDSSKALPLYEADDDVPELACPAGFWARLGGNLGLLVLIAATVPVGVLGRLGLFRLILWMDMRGEKLSHI